MSVCLYDRQLLLNPWTDLDRTLQGYSTCTQYCNAHLCMLTRPPMHQLFFSLYIHIYIWAWTAITLVVFAQFGCEILIYLKILSFFCKCHLLFACVCISLYHLFVELKIFRIFQTTNVWTNNDQTCKYSHNCSNNLYSKDFGPFTPC